MTTRFCTFLVTIALVAAASAASSLTAKWTIEFKDSYISLQIINTSKNSFEFSPTPYIYTAPKIRVRQSNELPDSNFPNYGKDVITPSITFIGGILDDNTGVAGNGRFDSAVAIQPNEAKLIKFRLDMYGDFDAAKLEANSHHIIYAMYLNNVKIYELKMKRDDKGTWSEE